MTCCGHLWAVGFDRHGASRSVPGRDHQTRQEEARSQPARRGSGRAVPRRILTLNGEPFPVVIKSHGGTVAHFLASLALGAPPLTGAAVGTLLASLGATADAAGISDHFVREVEGLIKPGTSVLFVLDEVGNMDAILRGIRGLGGTVLKTNVDLERARLIQSTLAASADSTQPNRE